MGDERAVCFFEFVDGGDGFAGDDEEMEGGGGVDVVDGDAEVVLVFEFGGEVAFDNFCEEGFFWHGFFRLGIKVLGG